MSPSKPQQHKGKGSYQGPKPSRATQLTARLDLLTPNEPVAIDIEFQNYCFVSEPERINRKGNKGKPQHMRIGRISVVNFRGQTILDTFARYPIETEKIIFIPPNKFNREFGVTGADLRVDHGAQESVRVEADVKRIVHGRNVILHGGEQDRKAFYHEGRAIFLESLGVYDTQTLLGSKSKLSHFAEKYLDLDIQQGGQHDCLEDTQTTMLLFVKYLELQDLTLDQWLANQAQACVNTWPDESEEGEHEVEASGSNWNDESEASSSNWNCEDEDGTREGEASGSNSNAKSDGWENEGQGSGTNW